MKKLLILLLSIAITGIFTVPSFAVTPSKSSGSSITLQNGKSCTSGSCPTVDLSANVTAEYASNSGTTYSADTYNSKGTQEYGGASDTTYIYYNDIGTNGTLKDLSNGNSADINSWTSIGG